MVIKNVRFKLSDGKFGHLSATPNNNIRDFIPASYIFVRVKMLVFQSKGIICGKFCFNSSV